MERSSESTAATERDSLFERFQWLQGSRLPVNEEGLVVVEETADAEHLEAFNTWLEISGFKCKVWHRDRAIFITEFPTSKCHGSATVAFARQTFIYNNQTENDRLHIQNTNDATRKLVNGSKQPDQSFAVVGNRCPRWLVEVAKTQTLASLVLAARTYFVSSRNLMLLTAVKLSPNTVDGMVLIANFPMVALFYSKPNGIIVPNAAPYAVVSFGNVQYPPGVLQDMAMQAGIPAENLDATVWGVGVDGHPPCDADHQEHYTVFLPRAAVLFPQHENPAFDALQGDLAVNLYHVQRAAVLGAMADNLELEGSDDEGENDA